LLAADEVNLAELHCTKASKTA